MINCIQYEKKYIKNNILFYDSILNNFEKSKKLIEEIRPTHNLQ